MEKKQSGSWKKVTRDYPPAIDWDVQKGIVEGEVKEFRYVMVGGEKREVVLMADKNGVSFAVWVSAGLRDILSVSVGDLVRINYLGFVKNERTGRKFRSFELERWDDGDVPF